MLHSVIASMAKTLNWYILAAISICFDGLLECSETVVTSEYIELYTDMISVE